MFLIAALGAGKQVDDSALGLSRLLLRPFAAFADGLGTGGRLERLSTVWTLLRIDVHEYAFNGGDMQLET